MNAEERLAFYIAMCRCCLLADAMKDCHNCLFNIGLATEIEVPVKVDDEVEA